MLDVPSHRIPHSAIRNPQSAFSRLWTLDSRPSRSPQLSTLNPQPLEIQRAFRLLKCHARHGLQVTHRGFDVAVPQQLLNRLEVVVSQQQVTCISVTERVRRNPFRDSRARCGLFDGTLNMGFMKVIPPLFAEFRNEGQSGCREEPRFS